MVNPDKGDRSGYFNAFTNICLPLKKKLINSLNVTASEHIKTYLNLFETRYLWHCENPDTPGRERIQLFDSPVDLVWVRKTIIENAVHLLLSPDWLFIKTGDKAQPSGQLQEKLNVWLIASMLSFEITFYDRKGVVGLIISLFTF